MFHCTRVTFSRVTIQNIKKYKSRMSRLDLVNRNCEERNFVCSSLAAVVDVRGCRVRSFRDTDACVDYPHTLITSSTQGNIYNSRHADKHTNYLYKETHKMKIKRKLNTNYKSRKRRLISLLVDLQEKQSTRKICRQTFSNIAINLTSHTQKTCGLL
jgi:hypothetical protein